MSFRIWPKSEIRPKFSSETNLQLDLEPNFCVIDRVKRRHISMVAIRSPFCRSRPSYCALLSGEDLLRYSNKIESIGLRKCPYKRYLTKKVMSE